MTPRFRLEVERAQGDGAYAPAKDVTGVFAAHYVMLTVTDEEDHANDRLSITLNDDPERPIEKPGKGDRFTLYLGYEQAVNQALPYPMTRIGVYVLNEIRIEVAPAALMHLGMNAADNRSGKYFKESRTTTWMGKTLEEIVTDVAARHGYTPKFGGDGMQEVVMMQASAGAGPAAAPSIAGPWKVVQQVRETDAQFLDRLGVLVGAKAKVLDNRWLVFAKVPAGKTLDPTKVLTPIYVDRSEMTTGGQSEQVRGAHASVSARTTDYDAGETSLLTVGTGSDTGNTDTNLLWTYPTKQAAGAAAAAQAADLTSQEATFTFECVGSPIIMAGGIVNLTGCRPGVFTRWKAVRVEHIVSKAGGYVTRCDCELPDGKKA